MPEKKSYAFALIMTASDGSELFFYGKKYPTSIKNSRGKITLFATKEEAELVKTVQNIKYSDCYDLVIITFVGNTIEVSKRLK